MRIYYKFTVITLALLYIFSCASTVKAPKWISKPPKKKGFIYATGTEIADRRQSALIQARDQAQADLAAQLQAEVERVNKLVLREIKDKTAINQWDLGQKNLVAQSLQNYNELKNHVEFKKRMYTAFVLLELNLTAAQDRMLEDLEKDAKVYAKLQKSEIFQSMEKDIDAYRKRRGY